MSPALFFNDSKNTEQKTTTRSFSGALKQVPLILVSQNCYKPFFRCGHQKEDKQTERSQKFRLHCVKKQSFCIALPRLILHLKIIRFTIFSFVHKHLISNYLCAGRINDFSPNVVLWNDNSTLIFVKCGFNLLNVTC